MSVVQASWRDCDCEWASKYCDENHVRYVLVNRDDLISLAADHAAEVEDNEIEAYEEMK